MPGNWKRSDWVPRQSGRREAGLRGGLVLVDEPAQYAATADVGERRGSKGHCADRCGHLESKVAVRPDAGCNGARSREGLLRDCDGRGRESSPGTLPVRSVPTSLGPRSRQSISPMVRKLGAVATVAMTVILAGCTSSAQTTSPNKPTSTVMTTIPPLGGDRTTTTLASQTTIPPPTVAATLPGSRLPGRTTTTTIPGRSSTTTQRGTTSPCKGRRPTALQPGSVVPVTELRGVDLLTSTTGVGVTFPLFACSTHGIASYPSWLVASDNSGQTWRVAGSQLPTWLGPNASTPVFASPQKGWLNAGGQLAFTDNGGRTWEKVKLGRPSHGFSGIQLAASGHYVAAMVPNPFSGVLQVWRLSPTGTQRSPEPALREPARMQEQSLEVVPGIGQLLVYQVYFPGRSETLTAKIFLIGAHQGSWQAIPPPRCRLGELEVVVPAGGQTLAAVCGQGLGMMHESKAFYLSANEGRTWQERSQLNAWRANQSSMPFQDLLGLAASSANTYYMATVNELGVTHDGGRTWSQIYWGAEGLGGMTTSFVDPQHGWILLPQAALLRTTDGKHWTAYPVPDVLSLCETSQLRLAVARVLGRAMSQDGLFFSYTNLSNVSCTLDGYAMLQVYGQRKRAMLTRLAHSGGIFFSDPGPRLVTLVPKASAYFGFSWPSTNQPNVSQTGCIGKATVSSTPPGNSTSSTISLDFAKGPLTPICRGVGGVTAIAPRDAFVPSTP